MLTIEWQKSNTVWNCKKPAADWQLFDVSI